MKSKSLIVAALLALALGAYFYSQRGKGPQKAAAEASPLYTGKEPKLKVRLYFPALDKPGFAADSAEIFQTASKNAQVKQLLLLLFKGPHKGAGSPAFPPGFAYREVFLTDKGLAVVDLDEAAVALHPGGTSSEFVSLYCLVKTILDNFREIKQVQILVGGSARESLAGHIGISTPLALEDF